MMFGKKKETRINRMEKVLSEVEKLRLAKAKSQAMAILETAYRNKEISAFDYERERTVLLREFD